MAAFASFEAAETRAKAKMNDKTWVVAHATRNFTGGFAVRLQRFMSSAVTTHGAWVEVTDDAVT